MDTEGCFGDIFDTYLEVISMYKVLQTANVDDKEQADLDKAFEKSIQKIKNSINEKCFSQNFLKKNENCYQVMHSKLTELKVNLGFLQSTQADVNYLVYFINSIMHFWDKKDWTKIATGCTSSIDVDEFDNVVLGKDGH